MKGNFEYQKVCKFCGNLFVSQKTTTKYCSAKCANRGNKLENRQDLLRKESEQIKERNRQNLLEQDNLSLTDAAALLGISRPTLYKLLNDRGVELLRITKRTIRVKKSDLLNLYQTAPEKPTLINQVITEIAQLQEEYISIPQALQTFSISNTLFYNKIKKMKIQPIFIKGKAHYPKNKLTTIFAKAKTDSVEWYTVNDIVEKFGLSKQSIYDYISTHKIPKSKQGNKVLISKYNWTQAKGLNQITDENYYTVPQAIEKYGIKRGHLYDIIRTHKISKIRQGKNILILRMQLDELMNNRKK